MSLVQGLLLQTSSYKWRIVKDGYQPAAKLYQRHYSSYHYKDRRRQRYGYRNRFLIAGPGQKMLLMTENNDALFVWRKFKSRDSQQGVNCAVFRNESSYLSSALIEEAVKHAIRRWPGQRLYTYVNPCKIKSRNPGYCFKVVGWRKCGVTKTRKLTILEYVPPHIASPPEKSVEFEAPNL